MNHDKLDVKKIYFCHGCSSNFPLCSFCNLRFHEHPFNSFCTHAASLFIAKFSELFQELFSLSLSCFLHILGKLYTGKWREKSREKFSQKWKTVWKKKNGKFCFPITTNFHSGREVTKSDEFSAEADANTLFPSNIRSCFFTLGGKSWEQENIYGCDKQKRSKNKESSILWREKKL